MRCIYHGGAASRKLEANIYRSQLRQVALACSLAKAGKEASQGGRGQVNRKGWRGRRVRFERKSERMMVFIFSLRQSGQPLSGNPSASPHCSSLWAATKGGNAGRGGKRE